MVFAASSALTVVLADITAGIDPIQSGFEQTNLEAVTIKHAW